MKQYAVIYKNTDVSNKIKFYENLGPYQLWVKIRSIELDFDYYPSTKKDLFFIEYDGYIWDCTNIDRLRQIKQRLIKELKV